jgi:hydrogenase/urease accessory protein HupE
VLLGSALLYAFGSPLAALDGLVRFSSGMSLAQALLMLSGFALVVVHWAQILRRSGWRDLASLVRWI